MSIGDTMSDFAKNLRKFRKQKGYSQEKLAKALHYGYTAITNYEGGRNEPSYDDLMALSRAFCYFLCAKSKDGCCCFAGMVLNGRAEGLPDRCFGSNEPCIFLGFLGNLNFSREYQFPCFPPFLVLK